MSAPRPTLSTATDNEHKFPSGVLLAVFRSTLPSASALTATAGLHYRSFTTSLQAAEPSKLGGEPLKGVFLCYGVSGERFEPCMKGGTLQTMSIRCGTGQMLYLGQGC